MLQSALLVGQIALQWKAFRKLMNRTLEHGAFAENAAVAPEEKQ
jgi:hypothetical protein